MSSPAREKISHKDEPKKIFLDNSLVESEKIPIPRNSFQKESYVTNKSKIWFSVHNNKLQNSI